MMLYAISGLALFMLILYIMPVKINADAEKHNEDIKITLGLKTLYGLVDIITEIPVLKLTFENGKPALKYKVEVADRERSRLLAGFTKLLSIEEGEGLYSIYKNNKEIISSPLKYLAKKISVRNLYLKLGMGTGEAASTGVLYGTAWIVMGNIMAFTGSHVSIKEPRIIIVPVFGSVHLSLDFNCIISIKTGHIINAGIRAIPALISGNRKNFN